MPNKFFHSVVLTHYSSLGLIDLPNSHHVAYVNSCPTNKVSGHPVQRSKGSRVTNNNQMEEISVGKLSKGSYFVKPDILPLKPTQATVDRHHRDESSSTQTAVRRTSPLCLTQVGPKKHLRRLRARPMIDPSRRITSHMAANPSTRAVQTTEIR